MPPPIIGCVLRWKGTHLAPQKHKCWKSQPWQQWKKQAYKKTTKKNFLLGLKNPSFLRTLPPFLWTLMVTPVGTHPIKSTRKDHEIQRSGPMVKILKTCHFCVGCLKTGPSKRLIVVLVSPVFFYHPHILRLGGLPGVVWHCHCYIVAFLLCTYIYIYTCDSVILEGSHTKATSSWWGMATTTSPVGSQLKRHFGSMGCHLTSQSRGKKVVCFVYLFARLCSPWN